MGMNQEQLNLLDDPKPPKRSISTRRCYWSGCTLSVNPKMLMCRGHWFKLPQELRAGIWDAYVPGQEHTLDIGQKWLAAWHACEAWIKQHHPNG